MMTPEQAAHRDAEIEAKAIAGRIDPFIQPWVKDSDPGDENDAREPEAA